MGLEKIAIDLDVVRAQLAEGASIAQIAEGLGVNEFTLRSRMTKAGIAPPGDHGKVAREMVKARALAEQGRSVREIAEALGMPEPTARWRLKRFGIRVRRMPGGRPAGWGGASAARVAETPAPEAAPLPRVRRGVQAEPAPAPAPPRDWTALDGELVATGGSYAALALVAARHGLTSQQARSRWHRLGLSVTVVK